MIATEQTSTIVPNDLAAHDQGYRFPEGFAGFAARLIYVRDGDRFDGRVVVRGSRQVEASIAGAGDADLGWLKQEIASMAGHRWPAAYAMSDGRWSLAFGPDDAHPLGRLILVQDDPFASSYRLRDGRIGQVNRTMGATRFSITIQAQIVVADGRALPSAFSVAFWDGDRHSRTDIYADRYLDIDGVMLPASRRVATASDADVIVREVNLLGHALLAPAVDDAKAGTDHRSQPCRRIIHPGGPRRITSLCSCRVHAFPPR